jgi:type I restriction enzyme S subunit
MVTWKETTLGAIGTLSKGRGISKSEAQSGKIPSVRYGEIYTKHNDYVKAYYSHISDEVAETSRQLRKGELLFAGSGETKEEIGKCVAFIDDCEAYAGGDIIILTPNSGNDSLFLGYYLNSRKVAGQKASRGQGDAIVHIGASSLADIEIKLPPLSEQRAIAAALSDMDAYIDALEKLIAKKRAIKKGAMQELLTGKLRLPGFSGEWVEKRIDELGYFKSGNAFPLVYQGRHIGFPFYKVSDFNNEGNERVMHRANNYVTPQVANSLNCNIMPENAIVFAKIGAAVFLERKRMVAAECCVDNNMMAFITDEAVGYPLYLCYLMQTIRFGDLVTATALPSLSTKAVGEIIRYFPPTKSEQTAIATVLSDMDAEIEELTSKLNKARNIRQGMMQELLTGRIRLVDEEIETASVAKPAAKVIKMTKLEPETAAAQTGGHNQQFDDAVMIAGIVNALYSDKYPLGRKKVQKCLYLLRRHQDESTAAFKKKAAGPYADKVRYKGGEPIALKSGYIRTQKGSKGTKFAIGAKISQALGYIQSWGRQADIKWLIDKLKYKKVDELELLATVDMAICDLEEAGISISVAAIKHLIATNTEWKAKLKKQTFSEQNIARAIKELQTLL